MLPYRKHRGGHYRGCPCCVNKPGKYSRVFGRYSARASTPPGAAPPARREKPRPRPEPRDFEAVAMEFGLPGPAPARRRPRAAARLRDRPPAAAPVGAALAVRPAAAAPEPLGLVRPHDARVRGAPGARREPAAGAARTHGRGHATRAALRPAGAGPRAPDRRARRDRRDARPRARRRVAAAVRRALRVAPPASTAVRRQLGTEGIEEDACLLFAPRRPVVTLRQMIL